MRFHRHVSAFTGIIALVLVLYAGCRTPTASTPSTAPEFSGAPSPLRRDAGEQPPEVLDSLTLDPSCLVELVEKSPELAALHEKVARETGAVIQGSFSPNPVLNLEAEMMPIDDLGFGNSRNKIMVKQRFETAGKAGARVALAEARQEEAEAEYHRARAELTARAFTIFEEARLTGEKIERRRAIVSLKGHLLDLADDLNRKGRISDRDLIAFQIDAVRAAVAARDLEATEKSLLAELDGIAGLPEGSIAACRAGTPDWIPPDDAEAAAAVLARNSELIVLDRGLTAAREAVSLAESGAYTDVTAGLGYARGAEGSRDRDDFISAFLEIPLPVVDRNQGAVMSAEAEVRQAERALASAAARALSDWRGLKERWDALKDNRELYGGSIIPGLERDLMLVQSSVASGRLPLEESLKAAVRLEEALLEKIDLEIALAETRASMILLLDGRHH
jgi:cobalt-zinc-cadmium efflux system outer membrane protein